VQLLYWFASREAYLLKYAPPKGSRGEYQPMLLGHLPPPPGEKVWRKRSKCGRKIKEEGKDNETHRMK
jgi:hypothetical protein